MKEIVGALVTVLVVLFIVAGWFVWTIYGFAPAFGWWWAGGFLAFSLLGLAYGIWQTYLD